MVLLLYNKGTKKTRVFKKKVNFCSKKEEKRKTERFAAASAPRIAERKPL
jgi:hypothetical protein